MMADMHFHVVLRTVVCVRYIFPAIMCATIIYITRFRTMTGRGGYCLIRLIMAALN